MRKKIKFESQEEVLIWLIKNKNRSLYESKVNGISFGFDRLTRTFEAKTDVSRRDIGGASIPLTLYAECQWYELVNPENPRLCLVWDDDEEKILWEIIGYDASKSEKYRAHGWNWQNAKPAPQELNDWYFANKEIA